MKKYFLFLLAATFCAAHAVAQPVRVLLAENLTKAQLQNSGLVYVKTEGAKPYKISKPQTLNVQFSNGQLRLGALKTKNPLIIEPSSGTVLTYNKNTYTGKIYAVPAGKSFRLIEHTDMENYLLGVLPYEMSYSWPLEALKAQAVAARTYTHMEISKKAKGDFDLYSDVRSQMYKGSGKVYDSVRQAVESTKGQKLTYKKQPFYTYYHANCGGGTDNAKIWTGGADIPKPLGGASCSYDKHSKSYSWSATVPAASVNSFAAKNGLNGNIKKIAVAASTKTGRADTLKLTSSKGSKTLSCAKFRLAVGSSLLKSCKITSVKKTGSGFAFEGRGYGHGIGMCQDGAKGMAQAGKNYKQILANYFPSSELTVL